MSDDAEKNTKSTTFTYNEVTERALRESYPHQIGFSERVRAAIADALDPDAEINLHLEEIDEEIDDE